MPYANSLREKEVPNRDGTNLFRYNLAPVLASYLSLGIRFFFAGPQVSCRSALKLLSQNEIRRVESAALCRQHSLPLVSRDQHFDFVHGLRRLDW